MESASKFCNKVQYDQNKQTYSQTAWKSANDSRHANTTQVNFVVDYGMDFKACSIAYSLHSVWPLYLRVQGHTSRSMGLSSMSV